MIIDKFTKDKEHYYEVDLMNLSLYEISLISAVTLMTFISSIMFFGPIPYKQERENYIHSRHCMGVAISMLALCYFMHLLFNLRSKGLQYPAILLNLSVYTVVVPFIYTALRLLMDRAYFSVFRKNLAGQASFTLVFTLALSACSHFLMRENMLHMLTVYTALYCIYSSVAGIMLYKRYRQLLKQAGDNLSEDIAQYVRWMSFIMYALMLWGPVCSISAFLPFNYLFIPVFLSIFLYAYVFFSYKNYLLFSDMVIGITHEPSSSEEVNDIHDEHSLSDYYQMRDKHTDMLIKKWIDERGYTEQGITLEYMAALLNTNRTYLSGYLHRSQTKSFREWINDLRIDYAKQIMISSPLITMAEVAERCGYATLSHFTTTFSRNVGISPSKWLKLNCWN